MGTPVVFILVDCSRGQDQLLPVRPKLETAPTLLQPVPRGAAKINFLLLNTRVFRGLDQRRNEAIDVLVGNKLGYRVIQ